MSAITKITVMFDDNFRLFHAKMKKTMESTIIPASQMDLSGNCYDLIDQQQNKYREYFIENQDQLTIEDNKKLTNYNMPEIFAITISLLINIDSCNNFQDVFNKIKLESIIHKDDDLEELEIIRDQQCICGQTCGLTNVFLILNPITDKIAMVGCVCIKKRKIIEPSIIDEAIKKRNAKLRKQKAKLENKICIECDKILRKNDKEAICNSCIKKKEKEAKIPRCIECQCVLKTKISKCLNCKKIDIPIDIPIAVPILNELIYAYPYPELRLINMSDDHSISSYESSSSEESLSSEESMDIYLYVPFEEKNKAKTCGAMWDNDKKKWYCKSDDLIFCNDWKIIYLNVPFMMKEEFKYKYGSQWSSIEKKWYINQKIYKSNKLFLDQYLV